MYGDHMDGIDWLWMTLIPALWIALLGVVIYVAVRLATNGKRES